MKQFFSKVTILSIMLFSQTLKCQEFLITRDLPMGCWMELSLESGGKIGFCDTTAVWTNIHDFLGLIYSLAPEGSLPHYSEIGVCLFENLRELLEKSWAVCCAKHRRTPKASLKGLIQIIEIYLENSDERDLLLATLSTLRQNFADGNDLEVVRKAVGDTITEMLLRAGDVTPDEPAAPPEETTAKRTTLLFRSISIREMQRDDKGNDSDFSKTDSIKEHLTDPLRSSANSSHSRMLPVSPASP